jgi:hypothetical protein
MRVVITNLLQNQYFLLIDNRNLNHYVYVSDDYISTNTKLEANQLKKD